MYVPTYNYPAVGQWPGGEGGGTPKRGYMDGTGVGVYGAVVVGVVVVVVASSYSTSTCGGGSLKQQAAAAEAEGRRVPECAVSS